MAERDGYESIEVAPVGGVIGAVVSGVDLHRPLSDLQRDEIHRALMNHLVLFFRGNDLSEEEQLQFGAHFGPPVSASVDRSPDSQPMMFVTLEDTADSPPKADRWHTDVPFVDTPPDIAILHMRVAPPFGGDTMWVNTYAAYDSLSPVMQRMIADLELDLGLGTSEQAIRDLYGEEYYNRVISRFAGARHPLVRVHPVTGRPALYLCGSFMKGVVGMHPDESENLLTFLKSRLDDPNIQCRWRWEQYDVAMWDERCTNHRALADHFPNYRKVRRCLIGEGAPLGLADAGAGVGAR